MLHFSPESQTQGIRDHQRIPGSEPSKWEDHGDLVFDPPYTVKCHPRDKRRHGSPREVTPSRGGRKITRPPPSPPPMCKHRWGCLGLSRVTRGVCGRGWRYHGPKCGLPPPCSRSSSGTWPSCNSFPRPPPALPTPLHYPSPHAQVITNKWLRSKNATIWQKRLY